MEFFDAKFKKDKVRYVVQCLLATVSVMVMLAILHDIANTAVIAALGASSFIAFTMPHVQSSKPKYVIGGYIVGIVTGTACYGLSVLLSTHIPALAEHAYVPAAGAAIGLAIFLMVVTNTEHPPAASLALGLALGGWRWQTIAVIVAGIVLLCLIKRALRSILINLL